MQLALLRLLGVLLALCLSAGVGAGIGYRYAKGQQAVAVAAASKAAIESANEDAVIDMQAAAEWAETKAKAGAMANEAELKGQIDAAKKANPLCSRDAVSLGLLNDSINIANGEGSPPGGVPVGLRAAAKAPGWHGLGNPPVGTESGGDIWHLSAGQGRMPAVDSAEVKP